MKTQDYDRLLAMQTSRRNVLKGAGATAATLGAAGVLGTFSGSARAQGNLRGGTPADPGRRQRLARRTPIGRRSASSASAPTKANVKEGEFKGVELTFMGLNNQNLHNLLFRGFLKPWEAYTGAKINWIDLAQADYNPRLQQAIATGTVDFDILEMGAPFEGDVCGKGLASEMPDWVKKQIDLDDYVNYLKPPVGTWDGKTYRITIDGDYHNFNYRTDYFSDRRLSPRPGRPRAARAIGACRRPGSRSRRSPSSSRARRSAARTPTAISIRRSPGAVSASISSAAAPPPTPSIPDDKAWLFDVDTMKPRVNNPAWVRAIQDVIDALPSEPADQINADPNTTGFQQFLAGTGSMLSWWGDVGSNAKTNDASVIGDVCGFSILPGSDDVYNSKTGKWEKLPSGPNYAPNMAYLGWGIYVMARVDSDASKQKAAWSAAAHLGGKDLSLWTAAYPSGFQPYRNSHFNIDEWVAAGYDEAFITNYLELAVQLLQPPERARSSRASPASSSTTAWPRTSWRRSSPARPTPRPAPTISRRPGRSSPTRSAARSRSSSTRLRSAYTAVFDPTVSTYRLVAPIPPPADALLEDCSRIDARADMTRVAMETAAAASPRRSTSGRLSRHLGRPADRQGAGSSSSPRSASRRLPPPVSLRRRRRSLSGSTTGAPCSTPMCSGRVALWSPARS